MDEDVSLRLSAHYIQPTASAHRVVFIYARPGEFNTRHAIKHSNTGINVAGHQAKLERARQIVADRDVRRGFHIKVIGIPDFHAGDAPSAHHHLFGFFHSAPANPDSDQKWSKSSPTPQPTFCPSWRTRSSLDRKAACCPAGKASTYFSACSNIRTNAS